jgi:hypothetical protein
MFARYLTHEKLLVRFLALLGVVSVLFVVVWTLSYAFLPEGLLRGRSVAQVLTGTDLAGGSVWLEWLRIFALNLAATFLFMVPANLLRTKRDYPLGYVSVALVAAICAVILGTNSFTLPMPSRMAPSLSVFNGSGVFEIASYVLAVSATVSIARWRVIKWWGMTGTTEKLPPCKDKSALAERNVGVVLAILMLALACGWEAYRISLALAV